MRRWFVFVSACLVPFLHIGLVNSIGVIFVDVMETFNATRAETATIQSMAIGIGPGVGILSGLLISKFGLTKSSLFFSILASVGVTSCFLATNIWHMAVSFGAVFGLGFVNLYICSTLALSQHFTGRKRLFMLSLQTTSAGFSGMAYPYILTYLSSIYGFRGALLIIGGISMNCIPCCFLWKQPTVNRKINAQINRITEYQTELAVKVVEEDDVVAIQKPEREYNTNENDIYYIRSFPVLPNQRNTRRISVYEGQIGILDRGQETNGNHTLITSLKSVLSNRYFVFFWVGTTLAFGALSLPLIFLADIFVDKGLIHDDIAFGFLLLNILNIIGRFIPGVVMQMQCVSVFVCPLLSASLTVAIMVGIVFASSRWIMVMHAALIGVPLGMSQAMLSVVTASLVSVNNLTTATGLLFTTVGIINTVLGPIIGYIRDAVGSYEIPIVVTVGIAIIGAVLFMVAFVLQTMESFKIKRRASVFYLTSF